MDGLRKRCGKCTNTITDDIQAVKCIGVCRRNFHSECAMVDNAAIEAIQKCSSLCYRCDECKSHQDVTVEMFRTMQKAMMKVELYQKKYHDEIASRLEKVESKLENSISETLEAINAKIGIINSKFLSQQSSTTIEVSERINRIENFIEKSEKAVVYGMSKVVEEVTKVVENKSSEVTKRIEDAKVAEKWMTVEKKKKKEKVVIIKPTNEMKSRGELKKSLRSKIDGSKVKINGMNSIADNGVILRCDDDEMCDKIICEVTSKMGGDVEVRKPLATKPRIKVLRINDPEIDDCELIDQLKKNNEIIADSIIEVIRREQVKRNGRICDGVFNIVLQVDANAYDKIMIDKKLKHHFQRYNVVDNIYIRRCYKCWGFNHNASDCRNEISCSKCAGSHKFNECNEKEKKCVNCMKCNERAGTNYDIFHDIWSPECSIYKIKLMRSKRGLSHIQ